MTELMYDFIKQFILNDETHKNSFFLHVQTVCSEKDFKKNAEDSKMRTLIYIALTQFCTAEFCYEKVKK